MSVALLVADTGLAMAKGTPGQHFFENWDLNKNADGVVTAVDFKNH